MQFAMAGAVAPFGLVFLFILIRSLGKWIEIDEHGLRSSSGEEILFDQIVSLDKKKWKAKGIAYVTYEKDGKRRRFVLDDCKYEFETTESILRRLEEHIDHDLIVGRPQPPLEDEYDEDFDEEYDADYDEENDVDSTAPQDAS